MNDAMSLHSLHSFVFFANMLLQIIKIAIRIVQISGYFIDVSVKVRLHVMHEHPFTYFVFSYLISQHSINLAHKEQHCKWTSIACLTDKTFHIFWKYTFNWTSFLNGYIELISAHQICIWTNFISHDLKYSSSLVHHLLRKFIRCLRENLHKMKI